MNLYEEIMMPATAELSEKFQISIPKEVREAHGWQAGQRFAFIPQSGSYLLVPVPSRDALFGIAEGADTHDVRDLRDRT